MKKIIVFLLAIFTVLSFSFTAYASETENEEPGAEVGTEPEENVTENEGVEEQPVSEPSIWDKLVAVIKSDKMLDTVSLLGTVLVFGITFLLRKTLYSFGNKIAELFTRTTNVAAEGTKNTERLVSSLAEGLESKLAGLEERTEKRLIEYGVTAAQVEKLAEALKTIADMFNTVYQGSSTVPAVVKEQECRKYNHLVEVLCEVCGGVNKDERNE